MKIYHVCASVVVCVYREISAESKEQAIAIAQSDTYDVFPASRDPDNGEPFWKIVEMLDKYAIVAQEEEL